jgi:hypothetical protein
MTNIIELHKAEPAMNPDVVLENAIGSYKSIIVIGWDKEGMLDARASLNINSEQINWLISMFQKKLLNGDYFDD